MPQSCLSLRRPTSTQTDHPSAHASLQRRRSLAELSGICATEPVSASPNSTSMVCLNHSPKTPQLLRPDCPPPPNNNVPPNPHQYHHFHHHHQHQYIYQLRNPDTNPYNAATLHHRTAKTSASENSSAHAPDDLLQVMEKRRHRINECRLMARSSTLATTKSCATQSPQQQQQPDVDDRLTTSTIL